MFLNLLTTVGTNTEKRGGILRNSSALVSMTKYRARAAHADVTTLAMKITKSVNFVTTSALSALLTIKLNAFPADRQKFLPYIATIMYAFLLIYFRNFSST